MLSINSPTLSTTVFTVLLIACLFIVRPKKADKSILPLSLSEELKGFAILTIVFSHIGYFLSKNDKFLYPLSTMAGVGVNLFLFLSGYGLSISGLHKKMSVGSYFQRLLRLFVPLWIVVVSYFLLDHFVLHIDYSQTYVFHSFVGLYPRADLARDVNSVLWYFSLILFYYLVFPLIFIRRQLWISALILFIAVYYLVKMDPPAIKDVIKLYRVHTLAFPLGVAWAWLLNTKTINKALAHTKVFRNKFNQIKSRALLSRSIYLLSLVLLAAAIGYTAIHSSVGESPHKEQITSLISMLLVVGFFIIKRFQFALFSIFGYLSYEVYLIHWPLMARYDWFYGHLPGWLATILYLVVFLGVGYCLKIITDRIITIYSKRKATT